MTIATTKIYTTPKLNLNGTSYQSLKEEWSTARKSIMQAIHDLHSATCHGRDFQCQEPGTWLEAQAEKHEVLAYMDDALELTTQWLSSIEEQRS